MTAKRGPIPRQGILDIAPYVPGTSALPGVAPVIKLSSNETPFGPSRISGHARLDYCRRSLEGGMRPFMRR